MGRALMSHPKLLMLDEPFSALDSYLREEVEGEVGSLLAGFGGTALLVTHNRDEAYRLCRDMIVMDGGQVLRTGGTKEVFADPQSTTAARLTGCKNILSCTRVDAHTVRLTGWDAPLHLAAEVPETCTAVGIRAHDFAPCEPDRCVAGGTGVSGHCTAEHHAAGVTDSVKTALQGAVDSSGFAKPHSTSRGQTAAPYPQAHYYMRQTRNCAGRKAPPSGWACGLPCKLRLCRAVFLWYTGTGSSPPLRALF